MTNSDTLYPPAKCILQSGLVFLYFFICISLHAQEKKSPGAGVTINVKSEPLDKVLSLIEQQTQFSFAYSADVILQDQKNITLCVSNVSIRDVLNALFSGTTIGYEIIGNQIVLRMSKSENVTINGFTRDKITGELLIGTSIYLPATRRGAASNNYGFYSVTVPKADIIELEISYTGYTPIILKVDGRNDVSLNFNLSLKQDTASSTLIIRDRRAEHVNKNQVDLIDLSADVIAVTPALSGSGDVISSLQMSAGVQAGLDGMTGYFVRGGNADQNQVLLDEAVLYNPSHLFNLVSVFNSSAIKRTIFLKGGFPASYGDYLSSILDIYMKDGNSQEVGGDVQIGNITSSFALQGPVAQGKSSYFLSGRRSMIDLTLRPFPAKYYFSDYYFYDVNAKLNFRVTEKDRLLVSYYRGSDHNSYVNGGDEEDEEGQIDYKIAFGNQTFNLRWNHVFNKKIFSNTQEIYGNYYQRLSAIQGDYFAQLYSGIQDICLKTDFYYYPKISHRVRGGVSYLQQTVFPASVSNKISATGFIDINEKSLKGRVANRLAAYASDDIKVTRQFNVYAGVRVPVFVREDIQYVNVEPRLSLLHLLSPTSSVKLAYSRMHQYIHLVQSYNSSFPAEIWISSSRLVKPQSSDQLSAGIFKSFRENQFQASIESYYKLMNNQMLFKGVTTQSVETDIENQLIFGKAFSYGMEMTLKKLTGDVKGWLSYSLSEAYQEFDSLNNGAKFSFANNRKHSFYVSTSYDLNKHWAVSANLLLTSGRSVTLNAKTPSSSGSGDDNPLFEEEDDASNGSAAAEPNNFRLTPYNRLDLGIRYRKIRVGKSRKWENEWNLAVYNVYAHQNTYFAYRSIDPVTKQPFISQISFIPLVPSLSYRLKF